MKIRYISKIGYASSAGDLYRGDVVDLPAVEALTLVLEQRAVAVDESRAIEGEPVVEARIPVVDVQPAPAPTSRRSKGK